MSKLVWLFPVMLMLLVLNGCGNGAAVPNSSASGEKKEDVDHKEHGSHESGGHSHIAPHGGMVNSIGDYHVELVHDIAASKLVFYIFGADGTTPSPIDAKPILGQYKAEGGSEFVPFTLNPAAQAADKADTASKFEAAVKGLEMGKTYEVFVRPTIEDRAYRTAYQLTPGKAATVVTQYKCPMSEHPKIYNKPGKCEICQMTLVLAKDGKVEHSDHSPKHGGTFFMASDNWHHLEGVLASATEFRLYMYDNFTKPISVIGYDGTTEVLRQDAKGNDVGKALKLDLKPSVDGSHITVAIPPEFVTPLAFTVRVTLQKGEKPALFNFTFDKPSIK